MIRAPKPYLLIIKMIEVERFLMRRSKEDAAATRPNILATVAARAQCLQRIPDHGGCLRLTAHNKLKVRLSHD